MFEPINEKIRSMNVVEGKPKFDKYKENYYIATFLSWKTTEKYPTCRLLRQFGTIGDIEVECKVLLQMNNVYEGDFGE